MCSLVCDTTKRQVYRVVVAASQPAQRETKTLLSNKPGLTWSINESILSTMWIFYSECELISRWEIVLKKIISIIQLPLGFSGLLHNCNCEYMKLELKINRWIVFWIFETNYWISKSSQSKRRVTNVHPLQLIQPFYILLIPNSPLIIRFPSGRIFLIFFLDFCSLELLPGMVFFEH